MLLFNQCIGWDFNFVQVIIMDISRFDDSTIPDVDIYYYENTDEIDLHGADDRYRDIEWDDRLILKIN